MKRHIHNRVEVLHTSHQRRLRPSLWELKHILNDIDPSIPDTALFTNEESYDHKTWSFVWDEEQ